MRRLEEQVTCTDDTGKTCEIEVYRNLERESDGSQTIGTREAFLAGDQTRPVQVLHDEDTFQTEDGTVLHRVIGSG